MTIRSTLVEGMIHKDISGELDLPLVIQHIDFIVSLKDKLKNHYELHDFENVKSINLSSKDMKKIASYGLQVANAFGHSCIAVYANNDSSFGMARMFVAYLEMSNNPTDIKLFRNKEDATQFLRDKMSKNG